MELNGIHYDEANLHEALKVFDKSVIKLIRYYPDNDGVYYSFDSHGRYVYEDRIEEPTEVLKRRKKVAYTLDHVSSSSDLPSSFDRFLSFVVKVYFDEWFRKILVDSMAKEICIHDHIDMVENEDNVREDKIKKEANMSEMEILVELTFVKDAIAHLQGSNLLFNLEVDDVATLAPSSTNFP